MNRRMLIGLVGLGLAAIGVGQLLPSEPAPAPTSESGTRLLSLSPSITETLFTLGAGDVLIGRSDYCTHPQQAAALPSFGTALAPNLEAIASAAPDLVLIDGSLANPVDELQALSTIEVLPWLQADQVVESIRRLGQIVHKETAAAQLSVSIESALAPSLTPDAPRMLALMTGSDLSKGPVWFLRDDSLHGTAINAAGFANAYPDAPSGPPSLPMEALLRIDPDLIVFVNQGTMDAADVETMQHALDHLTPLQAVENGRIGVVHGENLLGNGPGIVEFVAKLRETGQSLMGPT